MPEVDGAEVVDVPATEGGVRLSAVVAGAGDRGLLLIHGSGGQGRCVWQREIPSFVDAGYQVMAIDHACVGDSDCVDFPADDDPVRDIAASAAALRERGATSVGVIGASYGTAQVIVAAAAPDVELDAAIALSPGQLDADVRPETAPEPRTPAAAPPSVDVPMMYVVSPTDDLSSVPATRKLFRATPAEGRELIVVPTGHAQAMLYPDDALFADPPSGRTFDRVLAFLDENVR